MLFFFPACIPFPLCSQENQSHEKCICLNLTQSCNSSSLKLSLKLREIFIHVDLIHGFMVEHDT